MADERLRRLLEELNDELGRVECPDEDTETQLCRLRADIERVLAAPPDATETPHQDLAVGLRAARDRFEISHPNLTLLIERVVDSLSNMGI